MFEFKVRKDSTSDEKHILFMDESENINFRQALKSVLEPYGFTFDFDDIHILISHKDENTNFSKLAIRSDAWCVFGETYTWGKNLTLNNELIDWLQNELLNSGLFKLHSAT